MSNSQSYRYIKHQSGPEYLKFNILEAHCDIVEHCFTTRLGGVSTGQYSSLNLGFSRNDDRRCVLENFKRVSDSLGLDCNNMVLSTQVHDNKILKVGPADRGKGIVRENDTYGYDGLMTNEKQVALVTVYADCVPLFFLDPVKKVIALSHSGWKGTLKNISFETVKRMNAEYGCNPADILAVIGPSIQSCCFEVGDDVYEEFKQRYESSAFYSRSPVDRKWHIDLHAIIEDSLEKSGVKHKNICNNGICTKCNNDTFFSYRGDAGKTGSMAAIMQLK